MTPQLIYNWIIVPVMGLGFYAFSLFNEKVKLGIRGRIGWKESLRRWASVQHSDQAIWMFHAASVGELEALRPLIDRVVKRGTNRLVVTVFSPSAYGTNRRVPGVELLTYLPFDSLGNQRFLLDVINPQLVIISKHDVWPNLLVAARERGIHTALINANIHNRSLRIHPVFRWFNKWVFSMFDGIATVSETHSKRLESYLDGRVACRVLGDSRYDRVMERVTRRSDQVLAKASWLKNRTVVIAGSTHPAEEMLMVPAIAELIPDHRDLFVIWVPHDPDPHSLTDLEQHLLAHNLSSIRWSESTSFEGVSGVIVDVVGILAELYSLGNIAVVGGGFDKGVHSVIEPAAAGIPVLFGPQYHVSQEASYLLEKGGGFVFHNGKELKDQLHSLIEYPDQMRASGGKARSIVNENLGASDKIIEFLDGLVEMKQ